MNRTVATFLAAAGFTSWIAPGFNGAFFDAVQVSDGEGRIVGAIFIVGAAIVWFLPERR